MTQSPVRTEVLAALSDARLTVPEPDGGGPMAQFRRSVSRFSNGDRHAARRDEAVRALRPVDTGALRAAVRARLAAAPGHTDLMPALRTVPVAVLAEALGVPAGRSAEVAGLVAVIAPAYPPGAPPAATAAADDAVPELERLLGARTATLGCLLVQACEATAGLIAACLVLRTTPEEALRLDPPVRATARLTPDGTRVVLDLAAAGLPFGAGRRPCPGEEIALALAAGAAEALADRPVLDVAYGPDGPLRVPARLVIAQGRGRNIVGGHDDRCGTRQAG
ncbi:cytochrome P450 family protein [Actinomadura macrotermitis]|uniref:Cytochrome P450 n=1 Tax=Actinomadura macrotermitis TaxID=2585200 RepID=A0A7K0BX45_9ACTN|nr:hypothetical protein [Actinomadura macrotermitis]MQY05747.1 hypothetical protein [Actinomadura macrotermitis]